MPKPKVRQTRDVGEALLWLKRGKILAYPTESVWGLGCNAYDESAVDRLLALKKRQADKGLIALVGSDRRIDDFFEALPYRRRLQIKALWRLAAAQKKQALTWLFPIPERARCAALAKLSGDRDVVAIRRIFHKDVAALCEGLAQSGGNPYGFLVSSSCNATNAPPAANFEQACAYFGDRVCYFRGETLGYQKPSRLIDARSNAVLRF